VHYRILGATLAGLAFVIPSFLMVLMLGWAYVRFGGMAWMQAVFYGVGAAVIGIPTALIALLTVLLLWRFKKLQEPVVIVAAAVAGLILYPLLRY
jgi:chromate transporter